MRLLASINGMIDEARCASDFVTSLLLDASWWIVGWIKLRLGSGSVGSLRRSPCGSLRSGWAPANRSPVRYPVGGLWRLTGRWQV